jgi:MinD-like ATPase involved in chromosome partitioning or flagellar assembly
VFNIDKDSKYRLDLSKESLDFFVSTIEEFNKNPSLELSKKIIDELMHQINNGKEVKYSQKKSNAAKKATELRAKMAREKIVNAINILRMENRNITEYAVAKVSGCSINTVKKYREFIRGQQVLDL